MLGWLTGADWVRSMGDRAPSNFSLIRPEGEPARAWFVSKGMADLARVGDDPRNVLSALASARPIGVDSRSPESLSLEIDAPGPGVVVLSQLWYPRWRAVVAEPSGEREATIVGVFGGWQAVEVPSAGRWTLRLTYDAANDWVALGVSGLAWIGWGLLYWRAKVRPGEGEVPAEPGRPPTAPPRLGGGLALPGSGRARDER